ncbi:MAG: Rne/Rng family ribonuclease [Bacteroidota bacterium]
MRREIIMNMTANQVRIAITEDGKLAELFVEAPEKERLVGDIYLGKVARVMPGIKAAFIDIGLKQDAFLHFSDIGSSLDEYSDLLGEEPEIDTQEEEDEELVPVAAPPAGGGPPQQRETSTTMARERPAREHHGHWRDRLEHPEKHLQAGQDIIVQITKEPVGKKGVRVTSEVSLPGRFLVLLPFDGKVGVSKRIANFREKRRLRKLVRTIVPDGFGAIIRTVAEGKDEQTLKNDLDQLISTWREIETSVKTEKAPSLIYKDMTTTSSVIRDLFSNDVERVVVDSKRLNRDIRAYVKLTSPSLVDKIELYRGKEPIFDVFGVEKEIATAMRRKVWLKSGGYIIIEQTEAMVVVDVNSGRYAAKKEQELNSLQTNLESAREIVRQIRLRDIGGLIVIDFIDLDDERNKKKVFDELRKEFRKDRAKVTVLPMTEFGLAQITRQRIRQSVLHSFSEPCPTCAGTGLVQSKSTIISHIERWIRRFKSESREFRLLLRVHPTIASHLIEGNLSRLRKMMLKYFVLIKLESDSVLAVDEFKFISRKQNKDITDLYRS